MLMRSDCDRSSTLQWRHDEHDGVSNNRRLDCFVQPFVQVQIKENIKAPRHWPLCDQWFPHKGPVTRKICPFDDVIMYEINSSWYKFPTKCTWQIHSIGALLVRFSYSSDSKWHQYPPWHARTFSLLHCQGDCFVYHHHCRYCTHGQR